MRLARALAVLTMVAGLSCSCLAQGGPRKLRVAPADQLIAPNGTLQYKATLAFAEGVGKSAGERDITSSVTWSVSGCNAAQINSQSGLLTASANSGACLITAHSGPFLTTVKLTISTATLSSIAVSAQTTSVPAGLAVQFQATGNYSDLTQHDLTTAVTWDSSVKSAATISPLGLAQSKAVGTTAISAAAGGQTGSANFTVTAPVLQFVDISPQVYT